MLAVEPLGKTGKQKEKSLIVSPWEVASVRILLYIFYTFTLLFNFKWECEHCLLILVSLLFYVTIYCEIFPGQ